MDYKGFIYAIKSNQTDNIYIGSTTKKLSRRLSQHKTDYKKYIAGKYNFVSSFEIIKFEDAVIELIEEFEYQNRQELTKREGEIIKENNNCVNVRVAGRTDKEYYQDNKEQIKEYQKEYQKDYQKEYYQDNKEQRKEYRQNNKEKNKQYQKEYRKQNKERIKEQKRQYYEKKKLINYSTF